ncbi:MAG TPA: hypothetical protein VFB67_11870 [Candidatus Polarisedimenticolaceae bacterium]|nr:hypothetical protein [Candidatus Polarisedimenticolaceae bacterium]
MAGYSKRPLLDKLGVKPGFRIAIVSEPRGYAQTLGPLPAGATRVRSLRGPLDLVQVFAREAAALSARGAALRAALAPAGALWISWPKKASGVPTDLDESAVRSIGLSLGLVDVKVCAVDEVWSGLKFVVRLRDRQAPPI